jgi:hypothetical protein
MDDRDSFFAHAVRFLVAFVGDDGETQEGCGRGDASFGFVGRVARFVRRSPPCHGAAVVGAVADVLADARLAPDPGRAPG